MPYETDAAWIDPYRVDEKASRQNDAERRNFPRARVSHLVYVAVHRGVGEKPLVAQGKVTNLSVSGMQLKSRHNLEPGQFVDLAIPTKDCPAEFTLPKAFLGKARVMRVEQDEGDVRITALAVDRDLLDDMSYAVFVEYQHRQSSGKQ